MNIDFKKRRNREKKQRFYWKRESTGVISLFHREFVKTGLISAEVAKFLDIAFDLRNKSDYRDFIVPEESRVRELLRESEVFIKTIESTLKNLIG